MRLVLVDPPAIEPLDATEVRSRLGGIPSTIQDEALNAFIKAARQIIDGPNGWLQRALISQTWTLSIDGGFPFEPIRIPLPPLISLDAVRYVDPEGNQRTVPEEKWQVLEGPRTYLCPVHGLSWPSTRHQLNAVEIEFTAGFGEEPEDVPEPIRSAIALTVGKIQSLSERNLFISQDTVDGVGTKQFVVGGNAGAAIDDAVQGLLSGYRVFI